MSAVAGILGRIDEANRRALRRMSTALAHRGPDDEGFWEGLPDDGGWGCLLAHRRLAVVDDPVAQPLFDPLRGKALTLDGTVVNYRELSEESAVSSETQTLLRYLDRHGPSGLSRLRGMFTLALWDEVARRLLLARDALGQRPLYVYRNLERTAGGSWSILFASELRGILASGLISNPKRNPTAVASMVWNGFVMAPETIVEGIELLWPGEARCLDAVGGTLSSEFFWSAPAVESLADGDEDELRRALHESVQLHLAANRPVAFFLSGGIDSSSLANLAQRGADRPIDTFCLASEEAALAEAEAARRIASAIGSRHHEVMLREEHFMQNFAAALRSLDQPTFDGLNQYQICRVVAEAGMTVAVGGIGGDAIFGGDITLRRLPRLQRLAAYTRWLPQSVRLLAATVAAGMLQRSSARISPQTRWSKLPDVVRAGTDLLALYQLNYALFLPRFQQALLAQPLPEDKIWYGLPDLMRRWLQSQIDGQSSISAAALLETRCFVGERLLRDADSVSSALSLELRSPLCDPRIVEALGHLPESTKFHPVGYKPLLRKYGLNGLDPRLFDRPKTGFVLPFDRWIRGHLGRVMEQTLRDPDAIAAAGLRPEPVGRLWQAFKEKAPGLYWTRPWSIFVLVRWCEQHGFRP